MALCYIGTSGWCYRHWRECFYQGIAQKDWLTFYAERFAAVEINASFYRLQTHKALQDWFQRTPANFRFALKANRYLTHNKKLRAAEKSILIEKAHAQALGEKLAVVLWQLPANLKKDIARLSSFVDALGQWREVRHSMEFRHVSWFDDETADCLARANVAICQADAADWPIWRHVTTDLVYLRLHGHSRTYASSYTDNELSDWADHIAVWQSQGKVVHVYFNNDTECAAPLNALVLRTLLERHQARFDKVECAARASSAIDSPNSGG